MSARKIPNHTFSRRNVLLGTGLGVLAMPGISLARPMQEAGASLLAETTFERSLQTAYDFLDTMMDAYASGNTVRLIQSYSDQSGLLSTGFTYDNAVAIQAYLLRNGYGDLTRAEVLGNALIEAQATNFPINDGRFAQAYFVNTPDASGAYVTPAGAPFYFYGSAVGDQAWAGMALAQLYDRTKNSAYLAAAVKVANWIVANTYDTTGPGGYRFGTIINQFNQSVPSPNGKSTEHNIDVYAFFTMLAQLTHGKAANGWRWSTLAHHALVFVEAMFNPKGGFFYTGTNSDQTTINTSNIPEDVQTWSYLALLSDPYSRSLDWVTTHLATLDTPSCPNSALNSLGNISIQGETFATASLAANPQTSDPHAVWVEGSAHTADALIIRRRTVDQDTGSSPSDYAESQQLLQNIRLVQQNLGAGQTVNGMPLPPASGLVAATGNLDTGFGYSYFPNQHIGATGWYLIALQAGNPFQLGFSNV